MAEQSEIEQYNRIKRLARLAETDPDFLEQIHRMTDILRKYREKH